MRQFYLLASFLFYFNFASIAQVVDFADDNLLNCILTTTEMDGNGDGQIQITEAQAYTGSILCQDMNISDLGGLENVSNVTWINVKDNQLTAIDPSPFAALQILDARDNQITGLIDLSNSQQLELLYLKNNNIESIDLSPCTAIINVNLNWNDLQSVDVSNLTELEQLLVADGPLTELTFANNTALTLLDVNETPLETLDVTNLPALEILKIFGTTLTEIDVSNNPLLREINALSADLESIDVSNNTALENFRADDCFLSILDFSNNPLLTEIIIDDNDLLQVYLPDGGNNNLIEQLNTSGNPGLPCIQIDNSVDLNALPEGWTIDDGTELSTAPCDYPDPEAIVNIPDVNLKQCLLANEELNTNGDEEIQVVEAAAFDGAIECVNMEISDITGLEYFPNLNVLTLSGNDISTFDPSLFPEVKFLRMNLNSLTAPLDFSANLELILLNLDGNEIPSVNVTQCSVLRDLILTHNPIEMLDVSNLEELELLWCGFSDLAALNLANNIELYNVQLNETQLTSIDMAAAPNLKFLDLGWNALTELDVSMNAILLELEAQGCGLESIDVSNNPLLEKLHLIDNQLSTVDVAANTNLIRLVLEGNSLSTLDLSTNTVLERVELAGNNFQTLDLSNQTMAYQVEVFDNDLNELILASGNNVGITNFDATDNPNLNCILVDTSIDLLTTPEGWSLDEQTNLSVDCIVHVDENSALEGSIAYPNPASERLWISGEESFDVLTVFDVTGKVVARIFNAASISLKGLDAGYYTVHIEAANASKTLRIVKE